MKIIVGDTRSRRLVSLLEKRGWGRMIIKKRVTPYPGEIIGFDNGAYGRFIRGEKFDETEFIRTITKFRDLVPYLAVVPDIVSGGLKSLKLSNTWIRRLSKIVPSWNWYLAVQDGMSFKFTFGPKISKLAKRLGLKIHLARAATAKKIRLAYAIGADSLDSALPLFSEKKLERFTRELNFQEELNRGQSPQCRLSL